jgi:DnaJ-class molecular chaperone
MIDKLNDTPTPRYVPFKCPTCNGFGTVTRERILCHGCKGKGYIIVDQMTDDKLNENKHE